MSERKSAGQITYENEHPGGRSWDDLDEGTRSAWEHVSSPEGIAAARRIFGETGAAHVPPAVTVRL